MASGADFGAGALVPGTKYRVVRQLGEGGMGVVYHVVKPPQIPGVMKVMSRQLAVHEEYRQRFLDEVRVLAQLEHPNIVRVFDYDALPDGTPYFVMELLTGRTVREAIDSLRRLPPRVAFEITRQLLEALHAAHTHDVPVVHRDIKPENIFLHSPRHGDPVVKLIDFGVVAFMDRQPEGAFVGTWSYAAPEQIRGEAATAATDLYAVGLVLYEMLAGVGPFDHLESEMLVSHAQLTVEPPPVTQLAPWVPASIERLIASALSKDPAKRPRDAYAFSERLFELEWASDGSDPGDRTREGPLSRVLTTLDGGAPSAAPAHSPMAPGVVRIPDGAQLHGPTMPGVGGPMDSTTPGEDSLLDGLDARAPGYEAPRRERDSNRDVARNAERVVVTPEIGAVVKIESSPRPPTAVTEDAPSEPSRRSVDTFATQETTTTPRARAVSGGARWPTWAGVVVALVLVGGAVAVFERGRAPAVPGAGSVGPVQAIAAPPTETQAPAPAEPATQPAAVPSPPEVSGTPAPTVPANRRVGPAKGARVAPAPASSPVTSGTRPEHPAPAASSPRAQPTTSATATKPIAPKPAPTGSGGFIRVFD